MLEILELELIEYPDGTGRMDYYRVDETGRTLVPEKCTEVSADELARFKRVYPDEDVKR